MTNIEKIRQEIERLIMINKTKNGFPAGTICAIRIEVYEKLLSFIDSLPEEKPSEDLEQAAARYERENRQSILSSVDIVNAFIEGAKWMENQMPMPEDTVIFQKGVAEGRRLEREDNNKALAEMYGYEGGTESPLVKITFTIPKEQVKNLMPIKQGDVFGIENLTNKEGRR